MIKYKAGVSTVGLHWRMRKVLKVANRVWGFLGLDPVVTAALEDGHGEWSWHPYGCAIDLRTNDVSKSTALSLVAGLQHDLQAPYQIIHHIDEGRNNHVHIEFDPVAFGLDQ